MNSYDAYDLTYRTGVSNLKLEKVISKNVYCSWSYASNVLNCRFELGESMISEHAYHSWNYALYVLKGRFKLGEGVIVQNMHFNYYYNYFIKIMRYNHE